LKEVADFGNDEALLQKDLCQLASLVLEYFKIQHLVLDKMSPDSFDSLNNHAIFVSSSLWHLPPYNNLQKRSHNKSRNFNLAKGNVNMFKVIVQLEVTWYSFAYMLVEKLLEDH
jgi:hypothetical protein